MSELCPVEVRSDLYVRDDQLENFQQPDSVLDSHLLLLKQKRLCDIIFTFQNSTEQIEAHQLYLRERSPVFDLIFRTCDSSAPGGTKRKLEIADSTPARFWEFLEFIYADKFAVGIAGALDLLHLAVKYKVEPLKKKCEALIKTEVNIDDALEVFETAYRHGKHDVMEKAGVLLAKHAGILLSKLLDAQDFTLTYLYRRDDLTVKECDLFAFLIRWGMNHPGGESDLKGVLKNLIYLVRYTCMTPNEFTTIVVPTGLLSAEEIVQVYSYFGSQPAGRSEIGKNLKFSVAPRRVEVVVEGVPFYSNATKSRSHIGNEPLKECISYMSKIGQNTSPHVWSELSMKRPSIASIGIRWPYRAVKNSYNKSQSLNFKVALKWCIGSVEDSNVEEKFSVTLADCVGGKYEEILVEPPVELINGIKYCITVEDLSTHAMSSSTPNRYAFKQQPIGFTYWAPYDFSEPIKDSSVINLERWSIELRDLDQNKNLTGFGNYPRFQVVTGLVIALV